LFSDRAYVTRILKDQGHVVRAHEYQVQGQSVKNQEATVLGGAKKDEIVIVGAHYDSVANCAGANDNATGVTSVLEMARAFKDARPDRTIRFVLFVNEEPPYFQTDQMGSLVYVRTCKARGDNVVAMISMETIGFYSDAKDSQHYPPPFDQFYPDTGNFIGFAANPQSKQLLFDVVASFRRHTKFPSEGVATTPDIPGIGWSDHWSFWQVGYPAIMVTDTAPFRYEHYHEPTDTPEKIDYDRTARVVAGMTRVVKELAGPGA
jgi:Zn-dependent M28 family amino/carboxypeptidase